MFELENSQIAALLLATGLVGSTSVPTSAAVSIAGRIQAGGGPVAGSTVTLWAASSAEPRQLAQSRAGSDGRFSLRTDATPAGDAILYLTAKGGIPTSKTSEDNAAIAFLTVLGDKVRDLLRHGQASELTTDRAGQTALASTRGRVGCAEFASRSSSDVAAGTQPARSLG